MPTKIPRKPWKDRSPADRARALEGAVTMLQAFRASDQVIARPSPQFKARKEVPVAHPKKIRLGPVIDTQNVPTPNLGSSFRYLRTAVTPEGKTVVLGSQNLKYWQGTVDPAYDRGKTVVATPYRKD